MQEEAIQSVTVRGKEVKITPEILERFWSKIDKENNPNDCWEWMACKNRKGYGDFGINGITYQAHRLSFLIHNGGSVDGMLVCHKCDNPSCVNPDHLWVGTTQENTLDMLKKGRSLKGEYHPISKLTEEIVLRIRLLYQGGGHSHSTLSQMFAIHSRTVGNIVNRERWAHV